jgi:periplasmic protein TonB
MLNLIAFRTLVPVTASVLIHAGIVTTIVLGAGGTSDTPPMLVAELVEAEAPPVVTPAPPSPKPIVRDRRPVTPPRPIAAPLPEPPAPARSEPEPPKPVAPEPPRPVAPEPPKAAIAEPPAAPPPERDTTKAVTSAPAVPTSPVPTGPTASVAGPTIAASPEPGTSAFTLPSAPAGPPTAAPPPAAPPSTTRGSLAAAIPPDGVTQRAIPRGGYQYRPAYPSSARNLGIQGTTLLHVLVSDTGRVAEVVVKQSAGHPDLDRAATDAVFRWRFEPGRRGTEPVEMWVQLPFEFRLR